MNEIEELCRQVVKFIPDDTPSSSTEFNRPSFAAKTTLLLAADEIARLTEENERLRAENAKIDEYRCVIVDISEQCRELEAENEKLRRTTNNV